MEQLFVPQLQPEKNKCLVSLQMFHISQIWNIFFVPQLQPGKNKCLVSLQLFHISRIWNSFLYHNYSRGKNKCLVSLQLFHISQIWNSFSYLVNNRDPAAVKEPLFLTNQQNTMNTLFSGGLNIAIKIPKSKYEATVSFYRDILQLPVTEKPIDNPTVSRTHEVRFGANTVWLDCVDNYTHSETWLELKTADVPGATAYLQSKGVHTCDELEQIPHGMHWIMDPAGTVFILSKKEEQAL
jgi:hypothetical protein